MKIPVLVIGGGLSGLAAAIRIARFSNEVLLLEKHSRLGGLNSYFYRKNKLFETGLHAITNYAEQGDKSAPLNRLLRQLKLKRKNLTFCQQLQSKVVFKNKQSLHFSNDFALFETEISIKFPTAADNFQKLIKVLAEFDPFAPAPFRSAKQFLLDILKTPLLVDMILCPLMYYGSSKEDDMDLSQFAIMFRAIYQEGMFRPQGTIKDFIDMLTTHLEGFGGRIRKNCGVKEIFKRDHATGVKLDSGEEIECDYIVSTIGYQETLNLLQEQPQKTVIQADRLGFMETIFQVEELNSLNVTKDTTIIFFNDRDKFAYRSPDQLADFSSGVVCFPDNFDGVDCHNGSEIRSTHLANYDKWKAIYPDKANYMSHKKDAAATSLKRVEELVGKFGTNISFQNTFTPVTIERYTSKIQGAIYGSPTKIKDGDIGLDNIFLAGTDQGFLGIVGSMLSGVSIANQHILPKI